MEDHTNFHEQYLEAKATKEDDQYEEEDALSLTDFPITSSYKVQEHRRSSSEPISDHHAFEFFNAVTSSDTIIMSHAEDLIFGGKLLPYKNHQPRGFDHQTLKSLSANDASESSRKYRHSSPQLNPATPNGPRPLGCESVMESEPLDVKVSKGLVKCERSKVFKRRWSILAFGPMRLELMDIGNMKSPQLRRCTWSMFPPGDRSDQPRSSWVHELLGVLSCKTHASVAVTASIGGYGLVPHV